MKKLILLFLLLVVPLYTNSATTPLQRFLLINDLEVWLNGGESLIDWTEFRKGKKIIVSPNGYSLVKIYYDFRRNIFAAEKEYTGVIQRTKMPFSSVERNDRSEPIVVFDTGYGNHIYAVGLSVKEAQTLKVGTSLDLLCIGFRLGVYDNDMSATCSLFTSPTKFIAVNNIQHEYAEKSIETIWAKIKNLDKFNELLEKKDMDEFDVKCAFIDTTNYETCSTLLNNMMGNLEKNNLKVQ